MPCNGGRLRRLPAAGARTRGVSAHRLPPTFFHQRPPYAQGVRLVGRLAKVLALDAAHVHGVDAAFLGVATLQRAADRSADAANDVSGCARRQRPSVLSPRTSVKATSSPAFSPSLVCGSPESAGPAPGSQPRHTPPHALATPNAPAVDNVGAAVREHIAARGFDLAAAGVGLPDVARRLPSLPVALRAHGRAPVRLLCPAARLGALAPHLDVDAAGRERQQADRVELALALGDGERDLLPDPHRVGRVGPLGLVEEDLPRCGNPRAMAVRQPPLCEDRLASKAQRRTLFSCSAVLMKPKLSLSRTTKPTVRFSSAGFSSTMAIARGRGWPRHRPLVTARERELISASAAAQSAHEPARPRRTLGVFLPSVAVGEGTNATMSPGRRPVQPLSMSDSVKAKMSASSLLGTSSPRSATRPAQQGARKNARQAWHAVSGASNVRPARTVHPQHAQEAKVRLGALLLGSLRKKQDPRQVPSLRVSSPSGGPASNGGGADAVPTRPWAARARRCRAAWCRTWPARRPCWRRSRQGPPQPPPVRATGRARRRPPPPPRLGAAPQQCPPQTSCPWRARRTAKTRRRRRP